MTLRRKITFVPIIVKNAVCLAFRGRVLKLKISEVFPSTAGPGVGDLNRLEMHALSRGTGSQSHVALLEQRMAGCQLSPL